MSESSTMTSVNRVLADTQRLAVLRPGFSPDEPMSARAWVERMMLIPQLTLPEEAASIFYRIMDTELDELCPTSDDNLNLASFAPRLTSLVDALAARAGPPSVLTPINNGEFPPSVVSTRAPSANVRDLFAAFLCNEGFELESAVAVTEAIANAKYRVPLSLGKALGNAGALVIGAQIGRHALRFGEIPATIEGARELLPLGNPEIMKSLRNEIYDTTIVPGQNLINGLVLAGRATWTDTGIEINGDIVPVGGYRECASSEAGDRITSSLGAELNANYSYSHTTAADIKAAMLIGMGCKYVRRDGFHSFDIEARTKETASALETIRKTDGHGSRARFWANVRLWVMKFAAHIKDINPTFKIYALEGGDHFSSLVEMVKPRYCPKEVRDALDILATQAEGFFTAIRLLIRDVSDKSTVKLARDAPQSTENGVATREAASRAIMGHLTLAKAVPTTVVGKMVKEMNIKQLFDYAAPAEFAALCKLANIYIASNVPASAGFAVDASPGSIEKIVDTSRRLVRASVGDKTSESDNVRHMVSALCDEHIFGVHLSLVGNCVDVGLGLQELKRHEDGFSGVLRRARKGSDSGGAVGVEVYDNAWNYPVGRVLARNFGMTRAALDSHVSAYCVRNNPEDYSNSPAARFAVSPKDLTPGHGVGKSVICNFPFHAAVKNKDSGYSAVDAQTVIVERICKAEYESGMIFLQMNHEFNQRLHNSGLPAQSAILVSLANHYNTVSFAPVSRAHNGCFWAVFSKRRPVALTADAAAVNNMVALTYANWTNFMARYSIAIMLSDLEKNFATVLGHAAPRYPSKVTLSRLYKGYGEAPVDHVPPSSDLRDYRFVGKKKAVVDSALAVDAEAYVPRVVDFAADDFSVAVQLEEGIIIAPVVPPAPAGEDKAAGKEPDDDE